LIWLTVLPAPATAYIGSILIYHLGAGYSTMGTFLEGIEGCILDSIRDIGLTDA
jgi:hypothetical protein